MDITHLAPPAEAASDGSVALLWACGLLAFIVVVGFPSLFMLLRKDVREMDAKWREAVSDQWTFINEFVASQAAALERNHERQMAVLQSLKDAEVGRRG